MLSYIPPNRRRSFTPDSRKQRRRRGVREERKRRNSTEAAAAAGLLDTRAGTAGKSRGSALKTSRSRGALHVQARYGQQEKSPLFSGRDSVNCREEIRLRASALWSTFPRGDVEGRKEEREDDGATPGNENRRRAEYASNCIPFAFVLSNGLWKF